MSDYTPSMDELSNLYVIVLGIPSDYWDAIDGGEARARWDRAIAAHDAELRAKIAAEIRALPLRDNYGELSASEMRTEAVVIAEGKS